MKWLMCECSALIILVLIVDMVCTGKTTVTIIGNVGSTSGSTLKHCVIPSAENTIYQVMDANTKEHVTLAPFSAVQGNGAVVHIECQGQRVGSSWFGQDYMVCYNGQWYPPGNVCIKFCPPLNGLNSLIECTLNGEPVSCQARVQPRTVASKRCKPGYDDASAITNAENICLGTGEWSFEFVDCFISCEGIDKEYKSNDTDLMELVRSPWTAGVYRWDNHTGDFVFVCSALVVGTDLIVTASHCVQENGTAISPELVRVAVGKSYVNWNDERDLYSQTLTVNQITDDRFHAIAAFGYNGVLEMLKSMSFLLLHERVEFNSFIRAICADSKAYSNNIRYLNGTVTGWDETGKRVINETTFYTKADCRTMISKLEEPDEELEEEIMKFGRYCTDKVFPTSFLGTGAVFLNENPQVDFSIGVLTSIHKSFSIFVGPRSEEAIEDMKRFYSHMIDLNH